MALYYTATYTSFTKANESGIPNDFVKSLGILILFNVFTLYSEEDLDMPKGRSDKGLLLKKFYCDLDIGGFIAWCAVRPLWLGF